MLLSEDNILRELSFASIMNPDIVDFLDEANSILDVNVFTEAEYNKVVNHLRLEILDVERFVKQNEYKPVTDPRAFSRDNIPSQNGLLSYEIFGQTKDERAGIGAYIDLHGWFMDPSCYKTWVRMDKNVRNIVHGIGTYSINDKGEIEEDPKGKTGIEFLRKNIKRIKFRSTDSIRRDIKIQYLEANRDHMFIQKYMVIPPFYRDKNTESSRVVGLGGINKLYSDLIVASNSLLATQDYGFDASDAMNGRVQEIILNIYDWFCGNNNSNINTDIGAGMSGKLGILRRTNMSKTANFSSRLVISASELKVEAPSELMVNFDQTAIPLSACIAQFRDFILFHVKQFFENEFMGLEQYPIIDKNGKVKYMVPEDAMISFSDEKIKREMERYLHGYNNRFVPVEIPLEGTTEKYYMQFKGKGDAKLSNNPEAIYHRRLTWCDIFFMAAVESTKDKHVLITRFPIDSFANQITTKVVVSSTKEVEPMIVNGQYYKYYPKIREKDIGIDTSNMFVDTLKLSNLYLSGMGADKLPII